MGTIGPGLFMLAACVVWAAQILAEAIRFHGSRIHDAAILNHRANRHQQEDKANG